MKFTDFIATTAICPELQSTNKEDVIREMAQLLTESGSLKPAELEDITNAILDRERLGSTGIGRGIAVPHTRHAGVDSLVGAIGISKTGIDYNSLDGSDVFIVFMLVSPLENPKEHIAALERTASQLRNDTFCNFLRQANTVADIQLLLEESDQGQYV